MKHLKKFGNVNESSGFIILLAAWFLYDSLRKIPKGNWTQYIMENTKEMFSDFVGFLSKYGYPVDKEVLRDKIDNIFKLALGKLYKEGGIIDYETGRLKESMKELKKFEAWSELVSYEDIETNEARFGDKKLKASETSSIIADELRREMSKSKKIGDDYIIDFLSNKPEIEILFNKHFPGDDINNYTQKIPWRKSGVEMAFGLHTPTYKLENFGEEFDELSKEKGWNSQWDVDKEGTYTLFIYELNREVSESMKYLKKFSEINEGLPQQRTVDQLKKLRKLTKGTDIGDRISDMGKEGANIQYIQNPIDTGIESYQDYEKHNKKFVPSWNLKHLLSPFKGESKIKKV